MIDGFYEVSELAAEWGVTNRSIQQMCCAGRIPGAVKEGRNWRIPMGTMKPKDARVGTGNYRHARLNAKGAISKSANDSLKFMENVSQSVRSSLNAIIGFSDIMKLHLEEKDKLEEYILNIQTAGKSIDDLMANALEYARLNSGLTVLHEEVTGMEQLISEVTSLLREKIDKKKIELSVTKRIKHEFVLADKERHIQILRNVLDNAVNYTQPGGHISIRISERESRIHGNCLHEYVITDTGIGMAESTMEHLFDSFFMHQEENNIIGYGFGMPIVKKLLSLMKGRIKVESTLNKGTKVTITIPHRIADFSDEFAGNEVIDLEQLRGKRILLAEDNEFNREVATEILSESGFLVECAKDGIICVAMLDMQPCGYYDLILMDIAMPQMDGIKATELIRSLSDEKKAQIPIIAMTANVTLEEKEASLKAGMNGFIGKPMDMQRLARMIQSVFSKRQ